MDTFLIAFSVILLVPSFFGRFKAVGGGVIFGVVVGIIVGLIMRDFLNGLKWGFVIGAFGGVGAELLGMFGDLLRGRSNKRLE